MRGGSGRIWAMWAALLCLVAAGCHLNFLTHRLPEKNEPDPIKGLPGKNSIRVSQFVLYSDFEIARTHPLLRDLGQLREQVGKELALPSNNTLVQVYLFEDRERYERFMTLKYPDLPRRRAFFVAQPRRLGGTEDLLVYTYWGDRVQQDLRHELTHALLHAVLKDVPLWLDEGLAEFFELPTGWNGTNYQHLQELQPKPPTRADLDRLEKLTDITQMSPAEYRQSWSWVHLMLRSTPGARQALISYLQELRTNSRPGPIAPRLEKALLTLDLAMDRHLTELNKTRGAVPR